MNSNKRNTHNYIFTILFLIFIGYFAIANFPLITKSARNIVDRSGANISAEIPIINDSYNNDSYMKYFFLELNGLLHNLFGIKTMNNVTKLNNGYLGSLITSGGKMERQSGYMIELHKQLKLRNTPLLFVQAPGKINNTDSQLPIGLSDKSNENTDNFINGMRSAGISVLDLREKINQSKYDHYSLFFRTDHHWTPEGGFFAYTQIMERLGEFNYSIDAEKLNRNNYDTELYKDYFLGSAGRRTGSLFTGVDDIELIYPDFKTEMSVTIPSRDIERIGSFNEVIFDYSHLEKIDYYNVSPYSTYIGGDYPLVIHSNQRAKNQKTVLLVRDSFSLPVQSFLSLSISNLHVLDLRYYEDQSLIEYIDELKPDLVMFMYNVNIFGNDVLFQFGLED